MNSSIIEKLAIAVIFTTPIKLLSIKVGSVDFSLNRVLIIILMFSVVFASKSPKRSNNLTLHKYVFFNKHYVILLTYALMMWTYSLIVYDGRISWNRILFGSFSYLESMLVVPLLIINSLNNSKKIHQAMVQSIYILKILILLSFVQLFLDIIGITINYESIFEPTPENRANLLGLSIMRVNSVFGEPRDLGALIIPVYLFGAILERRHLNEKELIVIILIGLFTVSTTFLIAFSIYIVSSAMFARLWIRLTLPFVMGIAIYAININFLDLQTILTINVPRLAFLFDSLSYQRIILGEMTGDLAGQAPDLLLINYVLQDYLLSINGIIGNGLGSGHFVLYDMISKFIGVIDQNYKFGSRLLFFTWLMELGIIGVCLSFGFMKSVLTSGKNNFKIRNVNFYNYSIIIIVCTMLNASYFFMFYIMYIAFYNTKLSYKENG